MVYKAFVSSTFEDLKEHRAFVISSLRKAGFFVDPMEEWTASSDEPKHFSEDRLNDCDLCILLVACRRGHVPEGEQLSVTQLEYEAALRLEIDVLVFMLDESAPWPRRFDELDKDPEVRRWREDLLEHRGVGKFGLDPLTIEIAPALTRWLAERGVRPRKIAGEGDRVDVQVLLSVGERFAETGDHEKAVESYQKALAIDANSIDVHRRLVSSLIRVLEDRPEVWRITDGQPEIDAALTVLYEIPALDPALNNDRQLLLDEAWLRKLGGDFKAAIKVLLKALKIYPDDPEILANLGYLQVLDSGNDPSKALDLIRQAIAIRPDEPSYRYYLAQALDTNNQNVEAIREYIHATRLADTQPAMEYDRIRSGAPGDMFRVFRKCARNESEDEVPTAGLEMPFDEQVQALEFYTSRYSTSDSNPPFYLAALYHSRGDLEKAHTNIRKALGDGGNWRYYLPMVRLLKKILEAGHFDAEALAKANAVLDEAKDRNEYEETLEIRPPQGSPREGHAYKVGLKVARNQSAAGVLVVRAFEQYPFFRAGVRAGDRILEFAHRKPQSLRDIYLVFLDFAPGTDVPLKIQRGDETLELTLVIE